MRLLLDSHAVLWASTNPARLSAAARDAIADETLAAWWSIVSLWELALKRSLGELRESYGIEHLAQSLGLDLLPLRSAHVRAFEGLPFHHRDPFDRMLVAQALVEGLTLVTCDRRIAAYPVPTLW